jgi:hypothetical protein
MTFLSIWVFSLIIHILTFINVAPSLGFSFNPFGLFFAIGSFVFIFAFAAFGLKGSQVFVVIAMVAGLIFGVVISYVFGSLGAVFPFEYHKPTIAKPIGERNRNDSDKMDARDNDSDGRWINGVWGIGGGCEATNTIQLDGNQLTVTSMDGSETFIITSKSNELIKTTVATYRNLGNGIEYVASELPAPELLTACGA